jgi:cis-3-alkyl-4-acyloxetan-2-one decarboxylase
MLHDERMQRLPPPPMPQWLEEMVPFERYLVPVEDRRMHVMEQGEGMPVVMVHGNPTWGFLYRKIVTELTGEPFRSIMPDLVGLGFSDKPRAPIAHTLDNHARWLSSLLDKLDLGRFILVVQDWGGPIGLLAAADRPEQVAGLVVLNTVVGPPRPGFRPTAFHRFAQTPILSDAAFRLAGFPQAGLRFAQGDRRSIRGRVSRAYRYPLRNVRDRAAPLALARMVPDSSEHPSIPALERCQRFVEGLSVPTALVWGERDPILGRVLRHMQRLFPTADCTLTRAGHFLQEEVPGPIADAIRLVARG